MFTKYIKISNWSHAQIKNMFASIKISNWSYAQIIFPASFASHGVLNMIPVFLDGARPPPKVCLQV
jgi:hypothetical protein